MNEVNRESEIKRLCGEVNANRITLDEAVGHIADLLDGDSSTDARSSRDRDWEWDELHHYLVTGVKDVEAVRRYLIESVKHDEMWPTEALEFYSDVVVADFFDVICFLDFHLGVNVYDQINTDYKGRDIAEIIAWIDGPNSMRRADK